MTITMPSGLQDLASVVVGADFPEGDEDALRRLGEAWTACGEQVGEVLGDAEAAISDVLSTMEGQTADSFREFGDKLTQGDEAPLVALQGLCEQVGEACDNLALDVEYTKISIITALSILLAQIAAMLALAAVTFGASTAGIPAAQAATQGVVRGIMQGLLKMVQEVVKQIVINLGINLGVDAGIQLGQMGAQDRDLDDWDTSKTEGAALSGAAGGLGGGIANGVFGAIGKNVGGRLFGEAAETGADAAGKVGGKPASAANLGNEMVGGTAGGVMGAGMNNQFQADNAGEEVDHSKESMGSGLSGGAIGGGASGAGSFKDSFETIQSGALFDSDGGSTPGQGGGDSAGGQSGWQEWDGAPPVGSETEIFADQSGSSDFTQQAKDGVADGTADMKNPDEWKFEPQEVPPHLVNGTEDDYPVDAGEVPPPEGLELT